MDTTNYDNRDDHHNLDDHEPDAHHDDALGNHNAATPCEAAHWLAGELKELARDSWFSADEIATIEKEARELALKIYAENGTCKFVADPVARNFFETKCADAKQHIVSPADAPRVTPLIFDATSNPEKPTLYFRRQFLEEVFIARRIRRMAGALPEEISGESKKIIAAGKDEGFAFKFSGEQQHAVECILRNRLTLISGGPGTGKTTLLFRALLCILRERPSAKIILAAPTGKSAARIGESLLSSGNAFPAEFAAKFPNLAEAREKIATMRPTSIHSALGIDYSGKSRHDEDSPLDADVIVVDEASMISQNLMEKLLRATPENAKLILLGDKNQLDSVEPGHVFGAFYNVASIENSCASLVEGHRFSPDGILGQLAKSVLEGSTTDAANALARGKSGDSAIVVAKDFQKKNFATTISKLAEKIFPEILRNLPQQSRDCDPAEVLAAIESARILSPMKNGEFGSDAINARLCAKFSKSRQSGENFHGRPILITRNDKFLGLHNGDVGVVLRNRDNNGFDAWFRSSDAEKTGEPLRSIPVFRLPDFETAYATTVHKAQGSEFSRLAVILPPAPKKGDGFYTRQLLYTALTRSKEELAGGGKSGSFLALVIDNDALMTCVKTQTEENSLLSARLQ
ncbi:MAG: exodeoxyribonuclease V subunit alpha [Opitutae bacterium]|nr:exodeoxyribonuclease V subunit alpha [Opitutae bacterium]